MSHAFEPRLGAVPPGIGRAPAPGDSAVSWQSVLGSPAHGQHVAQLYSDPAVLARAVGRYVGAGLRHGEAILLVVTATHRPAIVRQLEGKGFAIDALSRRGQLTMLDATQTLAGLLVDGLPERGRFQATIGGAFEAALAAGYPRLRAFGEMVDVLRRTNLEATLGLEELWTELVTARRIALLCGYSIDTFDPSAYHGLLQRVGAAHSHLLPVDDDARFDHAVRSAYAEIFGAGADAGFLLRTFLAHYPRPTAMPDAQAAILAAQEFVPQAATALLERVRHHYHQRAA